MLRGKMKAQPCEQALSVTPLVRWACVRALRRRYPGGTGDAVPTLSQGPCLTEGPACAALAHRECRMSRVTSRPRGSKAAAFLFI